MRDAESLNRDYTQYRNAGMTDDQAWEAARAADRECEWREGCSSWRKEKGAACSQCRHRQ